ncbi:DUF1828 domain-containing protein [Rhizobium sp. OAE497]|uniref:DUF1828 domain-containing protein n=1 Tax=Rhizobium sp. OAE497 TaxID=2663796 RepID=UPI0018F68247
MTDISAVESSLHRSFSDAVSVRAVPVGLAVNSPFFDESGDHISFYVRDVEDGVILEDGGDFLPHLVASGIDIEVGQRRQLLDGILSESGAYWDKETFEIRSHPISNEKIGPASVRFLSALLRVRTLESLTKETIRSTFKDDATSAIESSLSDFFSIQERAALSNDLAEFPADIVLTPRAAGMRKIGLFLVNSSTQLLEAELLHTEIERHSHYSNLRAVALIEDMKKLQIVGERRYQRAINRGLEARFFRGDEMQAVSSLKKLAA